MYTVVSYPDTRRGGAKGRVHAIVEVTLLSALSLSFLASYPGLLRRIDKAWYLLFAHAWVTVEFHRRRLSSYTFTVRDEYSSGFLSSS